MHKKALRDHPWRHRYFHLSPAVKVKLSRVRACESTNNPAAVSPDGTYLGYYQYNRATAAIAGFNRPPNQLTSREGRAEQHVRTARYAGRVGWGPWPVCGFR